MLITISGKSGSGKSTLAKELCAHLSNAEHIDIDKVNSELFETKVVLDKAKTIFGDEVVSSNGNLNKQIIKTIIFSSNEKYDLWKNFMQTEIEKKLVGVISKSLSKTVIVEHVRALDLSESKNSFNILTKVYEDERMERLKIRENISLEALVLRDKRCPDYKESDFDFVFDGTNFALLLELIKTKI